MATLQHAFKTSYAAAPAKQNIWKRFIGWADEQEPNRLGWTAIAIAGHGCAFTIVTVAFILFTGNNFIFWPFAIGAMATCLIVNLAAMPTKITIPVLFFSLLVDITIILLCLSQGINMDASIR